VFWFRLNILCRVSGYRGHVVRRDLSCEIFRLGKRISERCAVPIGVLIILGGWNLRPGSRFKPWVERRAPSRALSAGRGGRVRLAVPWEEESVRAFGRKVAGTPDFVSVRSRPRAGVLRLCLSVSLAVAFSLSSRRRSTVVRAAPSRRPAVRDPTIRRTHWPRRVGLQTRPRPKPHRERSIPCSWLERRGDQASLERTNLTVKDGAARQSGLGACGVGPTSQKSVPRCWCRR
jgi:hypothetical protein